MTIEWPQSWPDSDVEFEGPSGLPSLIAVCVYRLPFQSTSLCAGPLTHVVVSPRLHVYSDLEVDFATAFKYFFEEIMTYRLMFTTEGSGYENDF